MLEREEYTRAKATSLYRVKSIIPPVCLKSNNVLYHKLNHSLFGVAPYGFAALLILRVYKKAKLTKAKMGIMIHAPPLYFACLEELQLYCRKICRGFEEPTATHRARRATK